IRSLAGTGNQPVEADERSADVSSDGFHRSLTIRIPACVAGSELSSEEALRPCAAARLRSRGNEPQVSWIFRAFGLVWILENATTFRRLRQLADLGAKASRERRSRWWSRERTLLLG